MGTITKSQTLREVEYILGSGSGILDFAVAGESEDYIWWGTENADWKVEDVDRVENDEEDRFFIYPEEEYFICEITADGEEHNEGPVRCYCE